VKASDFPRISAVWAKELEKATSVFPDLARVVSARVTPEAGMRGRTFGFYEEGSKSIGLSPRLEAEPECRIAGVVRHELGHACDLLFAPELGEATGDEARADAAVELVWGAPVSYDEWDVQTTAPGGRARPSYLHR
jgi:hypothetical protein